MALHLQTFKTRSLTALLFVLVMLLGLLWNKWSFIVLFTIIHFGCWYEFVRLIKKIYPDHYFGRCLFGLLYITVPILSMIHLRTLGVIILDRGQGILDFGVVIPCGLIFSIWINDTMAYIVGSFIGKTPFSKISPKKTWEGTIGGALLCITTIALLGSWLDIYRIQDWIVISSIAAVFGTAGDLLESKLKRMAGVKDSGTIMPGHGGFLDRFDSLLVALPFVWIYVRLFM